MPTLNELVLLSPVTMVLPLVVFPGKGTSPVIVVVALAVPKAKGTDDVGVTGELSWISPALGPMVAIVSPLDGMPGPFSGMPTLNALRLLSPVTMVLPLVVFPSKVTLPVVPKAKGTVDVGAMGELSWISPAAGPIAAIVAPPGMPGPVTSMPTLNELVLLSPDTMLLPLVVFPSKLAPVSSRAPLCSVMVWSSTPAAKVMVAETPLAASALAWATQYRRSPAVPLPTPVRESVFVVTVNTWVW